MHPLTERGWVHAELHAWNVLHGPDGAFVIDFDDCVFGPVDLEWATARIHIRAKGDLERDWPRFLEGVRRWFPEPEPMAVRVATAAHLVGTMAEFPIHLDMPSLADAGAAFDRYCGQNDSGSHVPAVASPQVSIPAFACELECRLPRDQ